MIGATRRTTISVGDLDASMAFYRDGLGLSVFYDAVIEAEASSRLLGVVGSKVRLISLQAGDSVQGMVGLMAFENPPIKPRREGRAGLNHPDAALLFLVDGVQAAHERVVEHGAAIVCPPLEYEAPRRGPICGFTCLDPDGVLVAVMRLGPLADDGKKTSISPIRRSTVITSDMDASLALYRDALGMTVFYDQTIESPEEARMLGVRRSDIRIVSLMGGDSPEGMVGLMTVGHPPENPRGRVRAQTEAPDLVLVFTTEDIVDAHRRLETAGAVVQHPPIEYEIPGRGICCGLSAYDPNGVLIELTQFGPLKQS